MKVTRSSIFKVLISATILIMLLILIAGLTVPKLPDNLNNLILSHPTSIYSDDGRLIKIMANQEPVPLQQISPYVIRAILSVEDQNFYQHHGISKRALLRAFIENFTHLSIKQGGSTITQQLAKNMFFTFQRSYFRKIQESLITVQLERQFSKDAILEAYLNQIDFGSGTYGIELAAQTYFAKHADELTLAEAAMLAGIPRWPAHYNPYNNEEIARDRFVFTLNRMRQTEMISDEQFTEAMMYPFDFRRLNPMHAQADYFIDEILRQAVVKYGENSVYYGGLLFHTTMNTRYQYFATQAIMDGLDSFDTVLGLPPYDEASWDEKLNYPQAALVAVDPQTGAIKAMVGGRDFQRSPFNRAVSNLRQPGSVFKPFTYLAAMDKGLVTPATVMVDEPVEFNIYNQVWKPENYDHAYQGPLVLKKALMLSDNVITAKLIERVTPAIVADYAAQMGITSHLEPHLSLGLGATSVSPFEVAVAYATIAGQGIKRDGFMVQQILTFDNKVIEQWEPNSMRVVDSQNCYLLIDMLKGVIESGTGQAVRSLGFNRPCAGKTGTTSDYRDAWFAGFTPDLVTVVWVGFDDNRIMKTQSGAGVTGSLAALPIWVQFMDSALAETIYSDFSIPPGIIFTEVDPTTGENPQPDGSKLSVALRQ
jgi:1A family penicillin-binding protein